MQDRKRSREADGQTNAWPIVDTIRAATGEVLFNDELPQ